MSGKMRIISTIKKSNTEILYSYRVVTENKFKNSLTFPDENGKFSNIKYVNLKSRIVGKLAYIIQNNAKKVNST